MKAEISKIKMFLVTLLICIAGIKAIAQTTVWSVTKNSIVAHANEDVPSSPNQDLVARDASGNIYAAYSQSVSTGGAGRIAVVKYSIAGVQQWQYFYDGGASANTAYELKLDASNNVYVAGTGFSATSINSDMLVFKLNNSGVLQWASSYGGAGTGGDVVSGLIIDGSGNVYIGGYVNTSTIGGSSNDDIALVKFNSSGVLQWAHTTTGPGNAAQTSFADRANGIVVDISGNIYIAGNYVNTNGYDIDILKYDANGNLLTSLIYNHDGGTGSDNQYDIATDGTNIFIDEYYSDVNGTVYKCQIHKFNSSLVKQWTWEYNGPSFDVLARIRVDASGNVYGTGWTYNAAGSQSLFLTVKVNSAGAQQWLQTYARPSGGFPYDLGENLCVDASGNVYVSGDSRDVGNLQDMIVVKYNSAGVYQWTALKMGTAISPLSAIDYNYSLITDGTNVYTIGRTVNTTTFKDASLWAVNASTGSDTWYQVIDNACGGADAGNSIAMDASGNVIVAGISYNSSPNSDFALVKYNSLGTQQFVANANGTATANNNNDAANAVRTDASGNVYAVGYLNNDNTGRDFFTVKLNAAGTQQWAAMEIGSTSNSDEARDVAIDASGNVYVAGRKQMAVGAGDIYAVKYNSSGTKQWEYNWNGLGNSTDEANAMAYATASGNIYLGGFTRITGSEESGQIVKLNNSGAFQWALTIAGSAAGNGTNDRILAMTIDASENVYVTGYRSNTTTLYDMFVAKYNSAGALQWSQNFAGTSNAAATGAEQGTSIEVDASGNVYASGFINNTGTGEDFVLLKYNSAGTLQWQKVLNGTGNNNDRANKLALDATGNVYVTGYLDNTTTRRDITTIKYNAAGTLLWQHSYNDASKNFFDEGRSLVVDGSGNAYVTGITTVVNNLTDMITIKIATAVPTITTTGTLAAFSTCAGTASAPQSFTVSGTTLTANIVITPPAGYEISLTAGSGYLSSLSLTQSGGNVPTTTIYMRLASSASTGAHTGNVTCTSTGATTKNVAATGTVNALPTAGISPSSGTLTCTTASIALTATGGGTYLWNNGTTTTGRTVSVSGTYTVTVTGAGGCTATASSIISSNTTPPVSGISPASGTLTCTTTSIALNASGGGTYLWNNGSTTAARSVSAAGTYTVTVTNTANGCTATAQSIISSNTTPPVAAVSPASGTLSCTTTSIALNASGGGTYLWNNSSTTAARSVNAAGTYSVTVTNTTNGCTATAQSIVASNTAPPVAAVSPASGTLTCATTSIALSASGGGTYLWSNGLTTAARSVSAAGTYTVTVTNAANGCTATAQSVITSSITPPAAAISPSSGTLTCTTTSVALNASGGGTYLWNNGSTAATRSVSVAGTYTVTVTNASGCTATAQSVIGSNTAPPSASISPSSGTLTCTTTSVALAASGGGTYLWNNGSTISARTVFAAGTYTVTVTSAVSGCTATAQSVIGSNTTPPAAAISPASGTITCTTTSILLNASGGGTYIWNNAATTAARSISSAGTYTVTVTSSTNGCTASAQRVINSNTTPPTPAISPASGTLTCTVTSVILSASGGGTYLWSNGSTVFSRTISAAGTYTVTVTDAVNGCTAMAQSIIGSNTTPPAANVSPANATLTCATTSILLTASGGSTYVWNNAATTAARTISSAGAYTVTVTDAVNGCSATAQSVISSNTTPPTAGISPAGGTLTCSTTSIVLNASGGGTYLWNNGSTTTARTISIGGTYTVTVTNPANSCTSTTSVTIITNNTPPAPSITGSTTFCNGGATILNAGAWSNYNWSTGATTQTISVDASGTFTVTVTAANGCTGSASVTTLETLGLTPSISGNAVICSGSSTTLDAGAYSGYSWSTGSSTQTVSVSTAGTYTVTVTNGSGCTGTASKATIINANPTPGISGVLSFCPGSSSILNAGSYSAYNWSTGATSQTISVNTAGTYTVTVTDGFGCSGSTLAATTVNTSPTPSISGSTSFCVGSSTTLNAGSYSNYNWSTGATTQTVSVNTAETFIVTVTDINGCTGSATVVTTVNALPTPGIIGSTSFCAGSSTILDAGAGYASYSWTGGSTNQTININTASIFTVTVTNGNGCTGSTSVTTAVNALPTPTISGSASFCTGSSTILDAGTGYVNYSWTGGATSQTLNINTAGTFTVIVTDANGCTGSALITTTINSSLTPVISGSLSFCAGSATTLDAGSYSSYTWSTGSTTQTVSASTAATFTVTVTDVSGCTGSTSVATTANALPTPSISGSASFCAGSSTILDSGTGYSNYNWTGGTTTQTLNVSTAGTFTVTITDVNGCTGTALITTTINSSLTPALSGSLSFCTGSSTVLDAGSYSIYNWSIGATTQTISVNTAGTFTVTVTDANGCTGIASAVTTVNASLMPTVSGNTSLCAGSSTTLDAGSYTGYNWSTGSTMQTISASAAGTYTVTVTDANGCSGSTSVETSVNTLPTPVISGSTSICAGSTTILDAGAGYSGYIWTDSSTNQNLAANTAATFTVTVTDAIGCSGTASVTTSVNAGPSPSINGSTIFCSGSSTSLDAGSNSSYSWSTGSTTQTISVNISGTYTVTVSDGNGCTGSTSVNTIVNTAPMPSIIGSLFFCTGSSTILDAGSHSAYSWSTGATAQTISVNTSGTFTVTVTDGNGCTGSTSVTTSANALTPPPISGNLSFCTGNSATLNAGSYSGYDWSTGETTQTISVNVPGTYTVTVSTGSGCTGSSSVVTTISPNPTPTITGSAYFCSGNPATLNAGAGYSSYFWSTGETTQNISVTVPATYMVTVTNASGCTGTATTVLTVSTGVPAQPSAISGSNAVCKNSNVTYSIVAVPGANGYTWTASAGASVSTGQGSTTVVINFSNAATNASISVVATNTCGNSIATTLAYVVSSAPPAAPSTLNGQLYSLCNLTNVAYSCPAVANAVSYLWAVPVGVTILTGQGTNSITVKYGSSIPAGGTISVTAQNGCGNSATVSRVLNSKPQQPVISGQNWACKGQTGLVYSVAPVAGATSYTWTVVTGSTLVSGQGTTSIVVNWGSINGQIKCTANNSCGSSMQGSLSVAFTCKEAGSMDDFSELNLFPNPASTSAALQFDGYAEGRGQMTVCDLVGQQLLNTDVNVATGNNEYKLDLVNYPKGIYMVRVVYNGFTHNSKLIVE